MITSKIESVISNYRLYEILYMSLLEHNDIDSDLLKKITGYIDRYTSHKKLSDDAIIHHYDKFVRNYIKDINNFLKTGKYPLEISPDLRAVTRDEYDIALMLSTILTYHRYRIMHLLYETSSVADYALFVGSGSGLELEITKHNYKNIHAYDIQIDDFCREEHPEVIFIEKFFTGDGDLIFDSIYLIEILEHLKNPHELLFNVSGVLSTHGKIFLTTATNVPQFDHLYNFQSDHCDFEQKVKSLGLDIHYKEVIPHMNITNTLNAKNTFYILKRSIT